ncbi:hypothetical protein [Streptomyces sp. NPDC094472]|uniref:hypothetical protein n=1 Tax=unclassified Streptomyces TaxID=2593676 RepID=UPI00332E4D29
MRTLFLTAVMTAIAAPALSLFLGAAAQSAHDRVGTGTGGLHSLAVAGAPLAVGVGSDSPEDDDTGWGFHGRALPTDR